MRRTLATLAAAALCLVAAPAPAQASYGCTPWGKVSRGEYRHEIKPALSQSWVEYDIAAGGCYVPGDATGTTESGLEYKKLYYAPGSGSWGSKFREIRVKYIYGDLGGWVVTSKKAVRK